MTEPPRVSVLLPVRDAEDTLREAVESIRAQTFRSWELILVDDGSTDGTPAIITALSGLDARIVAVRQAASGIVAALETARAVARAPLLARMDGDDVAHPDRLTAQVELLDGCPDIAICGTHVRCFPRAALHGGRRRYESWLNALRSPDDVERDLWIECPIAHPTFLMRAAVLDDLGGYRDGPWPEDYDLLLRTRAEGHRLGVVPRVLLRWREGPGRLSRSDPRYSPPAFRRLRLEHLAARLLPGRDGLLVWGTGPIGKALAWEALSMGIEVTAFVDISPRKIGQRIAGAPVVGPEGLPGLRRCLGIAAVGKAGARAQIRDAFERAGWSEGRDYVAMA